MRTVIVSLTEYKRGPAKENPTRCIHCGQRFGPDEPWARISSPGRLTVAQHSPDCQTAREAALAMALETAPELL